MKNKVNKKILIPLLLMLVPVAYLIYWAEVVNTTDITIDNSEIQQSTETNNYDIQNLEMLTKQNPTADNFINLGLAYYKQNRFHECISTTEKAILIDPKSAIAYNNICSACIAIELWEDAKRACNKALEISPEFDRARNNLKLAEDGMAKAHETLVYLKQTAEKKPTFSNFVDLGNTYYRLAMYEEALTAYIKASEIEPSNPVGYNNICSAYNAMKQYDKAIPYCRKALDINPEFTLAKNNLQHALQAKN